MNTISASSVLGDGTTRNFNEDELATAKRNIAAAFDTDGEEVLNKTELGAMQAYVESKGAAMDTAEKLLGGFSAPTFNIAAAQNGRDAGRAA